MAISSKQLFASPLLWIGLLFATLLLRMDQLKPVLGWAFPGVEPVVYQRSSFFALALSHLGLVTVATGAASLGPAGTSVRWQMRLPRSGRRFRQQQF
jgi:osmoprotectant transport system permease protein